MFRPIKRETVLLEQHHSELQRSRIKVADDYTLLIFIVWTRSRACLLFVSKMKLTLKPPQ